MRPAITISTDITTDKTGRWLVRSKCVRKGLKYAGKVQTSIDKSEDVDTHHKAALNLANYISKKEGLAIDTETEHTMLAVSSSMTYHFTFPL